MSTRMKNWFNFHKSATFKDNLFSSIFFAINISAIAFYCTYWIQIKKKPFHMNMSSSAYSHNETLSVQTVKNYESLNDCKTYTCSTGINSYLYTKSILFNLPYLNPEDFLPIYFTFIILSMNVIN